MAADRPVDGGGLGSPADHAPGVGLAHRLLGSRACCLPALRCAEQPALAFLADSGSPDVRVQLLLLSIEP